MSCLGGRASMETRITELFGIRHPIMLAGMSSVATPDLVASVCNGGGLGILACASLSAEQARADISQIRSLTDKSFGINITAMNPGVRELTRVAIEEKVPVFNFGLGRMTEAIKAVHEYDGKVIATVALLKHALRAEQDGVDALNVTGHEAAAHGAAVTSLVLIPAVAGRVKIPVLGAGGFCNGQGLAAALALGAEGISMGTRFVVTKESPVHERIKQAIINATEEDTIYSNRHDGMPGRVLKAKASEAIEKRGYRLVEGLTNALRVRRMLRISYWELLASAFHMAKAEKIGISMLSFRAIAQARLLKAVEDGDLLEKGFIYAGQDCGQISDIPSCSELMEQIVAEAEEVLEVTRHRSGKTIK
ncbi:NAD(P)H-dependent flavin oxidoreductase [Chloroflexota bacterium]